MWHHLSSRSLHLYAIIMIIPRYKLWFSGLDICKVDRVKTITLILCEIIEISVEEENNQRIKAKKPLMLVYEIIWIKSKFIINRHIFNGTTTNRIQFELKSAEFVDKHYKIYLHITNPNHTSFPDLISLIRWILYCGCVIKAEINLFIDDAFISPTKEVNSLRLIVFRYAKCTNQWRKN